MEQRDLDSRKFASKSFWKSVPIRVHSWLRFFRVPARGRSTGGRHFHVWFDTQVFGDAFDNDAQVARSRVAVAIEHPVKGLFPKARLARQLLERDLSVDQIAQHGKSLGGFAVHQGAQGFGIKRTRKF